MGEGEGGEGERGRGVKKREMGRGGRENVCVSYESTSKRRTVKLTSAKSELRFQTTAQKVHGGWGVGVIILGYREKHANKSL